MPPPICGAGVPQKARPQRDVGVLAGDFQLQRRLTRLVVSQRRQEIGPAEQSLAPRRLRRQIGQRNRTVKNGKREIRSCERPRRYANRRRDPSEILGTLFLVFPQHQRDLIEREMRLGEFRL